VSEEDAATAVDRWVRAWEQGDGERNFAIVLLATGEVVGDCEVERQPDGLVNVMYVVFAPWRGTGYGSRAVQLLIGHAAKGVCDSLLAALRGSDAAVRADRPAPLPMSPVGPQDRRGCVQCCGARG